MNRGGSEQTETDERVAENATPSPVVAVTDDAVTVEPATGLAQSEDDDRSPLERGLPLDPAGATQEPA
jgi:hypothetical protein